MVLLPICQGDPDVIRDVKLKLSGGTFVLLRKIMAEATNTRNKLEGTEQNYEHFDALLAASLESAGIAFKFVYFGTRMNADWKKMLDDDRHHNLSKKDYALLCAAISRPGMDVMTDDKELTGSINNERGTGAKGKTHSVMSNYYKRRSDTAGFIRYEISKYVAEDTPLSWRYTHGRTEFLIGDTVVASVGYLQKESAPVNPLPGNKPQDMPTHARALLGYRIQKFFSQWKPARGGKGPVLGKRLYKAWRDHDYADLSDGLRGRHRRKK